MFRNLKGWCCMLNLLWHILRQWVGILLWKVVCGFFCLLVISWWGVEIKYQRIGLVEVNLQRVGLIEVKRQRVGCLGCGLFVLLVKNPLRQSVLLSLHSPSPSPQACGSVAAKHIQTAHTHCSVSHFGYFCVLHSSGLYLQLWNWAFWSE